MQFTSFVRSKNAVNNICFSHGRNVGPSGRQADRQTTSQPASQAARLACCFSSWRHCLNLQRNWSEKSNLDSHYEVVGCRRRRLEAKYFSSLSSLLLFFYFSFCPSFFSPSSFVARLSFFPLFVSVLSLLSHCVSFYLLISPLSAFSFFFSLSMSLSTFSVPLSPYLPSPLSPLSRFLSLSLSLHSQFSTASPFFSLHLSLFFSLLSSFPSLFPLRFNPTERFPLLFTRWRAVFSRHRSFTFYSSEAISRFFPYIFFLFSFFPTSSLSSSVCDFSSVASCSLCSLYLSPLSFARSTIPQ